MASIRKRNDIWQARVRVKGFEAVAKSFSTRADADAWGKITEAAMLRGAYIKSTDAERTTLCEALERYERDLTPSKRGAKVELFRIKAWKAHSLATKSLAGLRSTDFARYRDERLKQVAPATVCRELDLVGNLFNVARREWGHEGLINPVEAIRRPPVRNARDRVFREGEESFLLRALEDHAAQSGAKYRQGTRNLWVN